MTLANVIRNFCGIVIELMIVPVEKANGCLKNELRIQIDAHAQAELLLPS